MEIEKFILYVIYVWLMARGFWHEAKPIVLRVLEDSPIILKLLLGIVLLTGLILIVNFGLILYGELPF